jgi:hypothetical protein
LQYVPEFLRCLPILSCGRTLAGTDGVQSAKQIFRINERQSRTRVPGPSIIELHALEPSETSWSSSRFHSYLISRLSFTLAFFNTEPVLLPFAHIVATFCDKGRSAWKYFHQPLVASRKSHHKLHLPSDDSQSAVGPVCLKLWLHSLRYGRRAYPVLAILSTS